MSICTSVCVCVCVCVCVWNEWILFHTAKLNTYMYGKCRPVSGVHFTKWRPLNSTKYIHVWCPIKPVDITKKICQLLKCFYPAVQELLRLRHSTLQLCHECHWYCRPAATVSEVCSKWQLSMFSIAAFLRCGRSITSKFHLIASCFRHFWFPFT